MLKITKKRKIKTKVTKKVSGRRKIGRYRLGPMWINVIVDHEQDGGWFDTDSEELGVGLKASDWGVCVSILIHEAMEIAFMQVRGRFCPAPDYATAADGYLFVTNHPDFSEICARVGCFLTWAMPDLAKVWTSMKKIDRKTTLWIRE